MYFQKILILGVFRSYNGKFQHLLKRLLRNWYKAPIATEVYVIIFIDFLFSGNGTRDIYDERDQIGNGETFNGIREIKQLAV